MDANSHLHSHRPMELSGTWCMYFHIMPQPSKHSTGSMEAEGRLFPFFPEHKQCTEYGTHLNLGTEWDINLVGSWDRESSFNF